VPAETLTFLFTDIQGSTALLRRLGGAGYADALADHHRLIRASLAAHEGREIDTQGDGFYAVFSSPSACVAAMIEIQRALASHAWPAGESVRVRMGAHSGEASVTPTGLVGIDVHRAARVAGVGHGGQSILSSTTAALVRDSLPAGAWLRDLGSHRLKDLGRPEQIFQILAEGLAADFPPLRSLDNPELPNNLPGSLSAFIGRQSELADVRSLVESSRLATLTGAGGSGKTRLALQVAAELLDGSGEGVWFVDLAVITDPEDVPGTVAAAIGIGEQTGRPALEVLLEVLKDQRILVILDNCEHVIGACAGFAELVERGCPHVHLLATSREPLGIDGERVYRVQPLSLPSDDAVATEDIEGSDAVALFVERARSHDSTFSLDDSIAGLTASICRRLDGIPFAIELAAARLGSMSLVNLGERLDQRLKLLTGGSRNALARQRTLQATVDWSYELLSPGERAVLCRLSVFRGSFELDAVEAVCAAGARQALEVDDLLGSLVSKSLVVAERSSGSVRYRLLETIRQYAAEKLARAGDTETRQALLGHAAFYVRLSEAAAPELVGRHQGRWLRRLDLEWDNIRAALAFLSAEPDRTEDVLRLGVALFRFFDTRGHQEPIAQLRAALERPGAVPAALRAHALYALAFLVCQIQGLDDRLEMQTADMFAGYAVDIARNLDDRAFLAEVLGVACLTAAFLDESSRAQALGEEAVSIARILGDPRLIGLTLLFLAHAAVPIEEWQALNLEAFAWSSQAGDVFVASLALLNVGASEADADFEAAHRHLEGAIAALEEVGASHTLIAPMGEFSLVLLVEGDFERAAQMSRKTLIASHRQGNRNNALFMIFVVACSSSNLGDHRRAAQLTGVYDAFHDGIVETATFAYGWTAFREGMRDDNRSRLRTLMGREEFERSYAAGTALSYEEAVDLALGRRSP
jgi:predicted ATPase/class 3 adenylate cyclase